MDRARLWRHSRATHRRAHFEGATRLNLRNCDREYVAPNENQRDGGSQFYLYRVALCLDPQRINPGYGDENHEFAADISVNDFEEDDLDAVRYLNVHEAMGVLSLAVRPEAIAAVQCIPIPKGRLTVPIDPELFQAEIDAVRK